MGGYAGGYGWVGGVDGEGVGGAVGVGVLEDHLGQVECLCKVGGYGCADEAAGNLVVSRVEKGPWGDGRTLCA